MIIKINGKNITITEGMKQYFETKMNYFNKFMREDSVVNVSVSKRNNLIKIETFMQYNKKDIKTKVEDKEFYAAVDKTMDSLKNSVSKLHRQVKNRNRESLKSQYKKEIYSEQEELEKKISEEED